MSDEGPDPAPQRVPKYKAPDFMRKEIELFLRARGEMASLRRYGDNDNPVPAVTSIEGIRSVRPVRKIDRTIT